MHFSDRWIIAGLLYRRYFQTPVVVEKSEIQARYNVVDDQVKQAESEIAKAVQDRENISRDEQKKLTAQENVHHKTIASQEESR